MLRIIPKLHHVVVPVVAPHQVALRSAPHPLYVLDCASRHKSRRFFPVLLCAPCGSSFCPSSQPVRHSATCHKHDTLCPSLLPVTATTSPSPARSHHESREPRPASHPCPSQTSGTRSATARSETTSAPSSAPPTGPLSSPAGYGPTSATRLAHSPHTPV